MKRILVIEDDAAVRGLIVETLRFRGWQPLEAIDGEDGLRLARSQSPDLIICDIQMPKLNGYGVLRELRANPATSTVPFVFLTGLGEKPRMRQAMEAGADDYIVKPFTIQELLAALDARFEKQAVIEQTAGKKLHQLRESLSFALPHELVTPLNSILGFSGLLLDSPSINRDELREYAHHIQHSAQRLRALIEKFLLFAHLELLVADEEQRKSHAQRSLSPTADIIAGAARRSAAERQRENDVALALEEVSSRLSPSHLDRVARELVENACKFSEPGKPIQVASSIENGVFRLLVADRGRGFSAEQIGRVQAHVQFDRKLQEQQGTGLGLAIAQRIAALYGGSLQIESAPGEGTRVMFQVPSERAE